MSVEPETVASPIPEDEKWFDDGTVGEDNDRGDYNSYEGTQSINVEGLFTAMSLILGALMFGEVSGLQPWKSHTSTSNTSLLGRSKPPDKGGQPGMCGKLALSMRPESERPSTN